MSKKKQKSHTYHSNFGPLVVHHPPMMLNYKYLCAGKDLFIPLTLTSGQCFNWDKVVSSGAGGTGEGGEEVHEFEGVVDSYIIRLRQRGRYDDVQYTVMNRWEAVPPSDVSVTAVPPPTDHQVEVLLHNYFHLNVDMQKLYHQWSSACPRLKIVAETIPGLRIIRQDPFECAMSFICSSNNNIDRIKQMLFKLRSTYGEPLHSINDVTHYKFPSLTRMSTITKEELRNLGFGYRDKFIVGSINIIATKGVSWLHGLRLMKAVEVQEELLVLPGVGRKVADCIALFSLDKTDAIPVDTHVWAIACRDYDAKLHEMKSLTPRVYKQVGDLFRDRFGEHAGWAHSVLFAAEILPWRTLLPDPLQAEMVAFAKSEKEANKVKKEQMKERRKVKGEVVKSDGPHDEDTETEEEGGETAAVAKVKPEPPAKRQKKE